MTVPGDTKLVGRRISDIRGIHGVWPAPVCSVRTDTGVFGAPSGARLPAGVGLFGGEA